MKFSAAVVCLLTSTSLLAEGRELRKGMKKGSSPKKSSKKSSEESVSTSCASKKSSGGRGGKKKSSSVDEVPPPPPMPVNDNFAFLYMNGCTKTYNVLGNDMNVGMEDTVQITTPPNGGTATVQPDGTIMYTRGDGSPGSCSESFNEVAIDQFEYAICDECGECSDSANVIVAVYEGYSGAFVNFDRRHLFALLGEGDELHRHLSEYQDSKADQLGHCMVPTSEHFGMAVTQGECMHPEKQTNKNVSGQILEHEMEPWTYPTIEGATLLAADPGIWSIDNFVSEEEADKLLQLMKRNGEGHGLFGPCNHESQKVTAHPSEKKLCFKISAESACEGPYARSECAHQVDPEDALFVSTLINRFESMWSVDVKAHPYIKLHHTQGNTPPMDVHLDAMVSISFVLYLSDGGAATLFPFANGGLTNIPKKGSALTWLDVHSNDSINPTSYHAVQAHPASAGERNIALFQVDLEPNSAMVH